MIIKRHARNVKHSLLKMKFIGRLDKKDLHQVDKKEQIRYNMGFWIKTWNQNCISYFKSPIYQKQAIIMFCIKIQTFYMLKNMKSLLDGSFEISPTIARLLWALLINIFFAPRMKATLSIGTKNHRLGLFKKLEKKLVSQWKIK